MSAHEFVLSGELAQLGRLTDDALLSHQRSLVVERRRVDAALAAVAGEISRRSDRSLGYAGLAARHGGRSAEQFIAQETGVSLREAGALVRVGSLPGGDAVDAIVAVAVESGSISVAAADALMKGLGEPTAGIDAVELEHAAVSLIGTAEGRSVEQVGEAAREARAELDAASVIARERNLRDQRFLKLYAQPNGMTRLVAILDPESAALVRSTFDAITSPRRGGPRFVAVGDAERAERIARDPRTTEQLALDGFVELLRLGAAVEPEQIVGEQRPAVRIHLTDTDLRMRGIAVIEGQSVLASAATAERHICAVGTVPIHFDSAGQVINVGREHRLYTTRQRIGLAARDGGCIWPGCDRPPSWCEAHHINEWRAHDGRTDLADGVLLCRFHHLMVHDQGWRITRGTGQDSAHYQATPPAAMDTTRRPLPLPSKRKLDHPAA